MSEFDQKDGHKKWFANPDFNPAQCNVVAAEHRVSRTTAKKHTVDYDCLGQLIDPRSRRPDFACPVWSARAFHPTRTERLAFTRQSPQLLRHLRPQDDA